MRASDESTIDAEINRVKQMRSINGCLWYVLVAATDGTLMITASFSSFHRLTVEMAET